MDVVTLKWVTFGAVFALLMAVLLFRVARRARFADQLRKRLGTSTGEAGSLLKTDEAQTESLLAKLAAESGLGWTVSALVGRMVAAGLVGGLLGVAVAGPALGLLAAIAGAAIFPVLARRARDQRLALCDQQMPQALEVMSLALRAGHPLPTALAIAAAEAPVPIADELRRAVDEHELGRPIGDVFVNMGRRLPTSESVHTFVVAVLVLQQTGGNLIAVIDRIVENARARAQYRAKLRALTAEGRSSARMLAIMPLAFGVIAAVIDPQYSKTLLTTGSGHIVLLIAIAMWGLGVFWTSWLVRTEG